MPAQPRSRLVTKIITHCVITILLSAETIPSRAFSAPAMIFFNGGMASASALTTSQINGLRSSGMTTMVIFNMGVDTNGNFDFGGLICSNGIYTGPANWASLLNQCKAAPSSLTRIEMCIGGWTDPGFGNIRSRIQTDGTNSSTILYRNLQALKNALPIDAIDFDTENTYDSTLDSQFGRMCVSTGFKVSLCPYTASSYWQSLKSSLGTNCDVIYLQCYDGGAGNNPATWNSYFGGLKVIPGYWDFERDTTFLTKMQQGKTAGCPGGFLWPSCTGCNPPADAYEMLQYGQWIQNTFNSVSMPVTAVETIGNQITFTASSFVGSGFTYQWQVIKSGVTNDIPGATSLSLTLTNLQLTNTASYLVRATNSSGTFFSSVSALTVNSTPSPVNNVVTRYAAQTGLGYGFSLTPSWTLDPNNLLLGKLPIVTNGSFNLEPQWGTRNVSSLTAGGSLSISTGGSPLTTSINYVTCGNSGGAGSSLVYTLTNIFANGCNLTNITVYGGWRDAGRDQQAFTVYYSKVTAPSTFLLLGSVNYNPSNPSAVHSVTRSMLTPAVGYLATNVAALKFDFTSPSSENGWCGYSQIAVLGAPYIPPAVPATLSSTMPMPDLFAVNIAGLVVGRNYILQSTTNLASDSWITVTNFVASQTTFAFTNSTTTAPQAYYRVVSE